MEMGPLPIFGPGRAVRHTAGVRPRGPAGCLHILPKAGPGLIFTRCQEHSLSPSCEGMLELLWELPEGIKFIEGPLPQTKYWAMKNFPEENLTRYYSPIHRTMIDILQNRALSFTEQMLYLGITIRRLQKENWTSLDPD